MRQSGKNSADIRMVVDALDLCYTKAARRHVRHRHRRLGFLPARLQAARERQARHRPGRQESTSDLLLDNCDEFIYYDDLAREEAKAARRRREKPRPAKADEKKSGTGEEDRKQAALNLVLETVEDLFAERGEEDKVWGSMVKQAIKRRQPGFSERYHGFQSFAKLLEEARERKLLDLDYDDKSRGYIIRGYSND